MMLSVVKVIKVRFAERLKVEKVRVRQGWQKA